MAFKKKITQEATAVPVEQTEVETPAIRSAGRYDDWKWGDAVPEDAPEHIVTQWWVEFRKRRAEVLKNTKA